MKPLVYLASPYTLGHITKNVRWACHFFKEVAQEGIVDLYPPLWSHLQDQIAPVSYEEILEFDFAIIRRCDAVLRCAALGPCGSRNSYYQWDSYGADREVEYAKSLGLLVFYDVPSLYDWAVSPTGFAKPSCIKVIVPQPQPTTCGDVVTPPTLWHWTEGDYSTD